jgi:GTP cyclohydrolase II
MTLNQMRIQELLNESLSHECEGVGPNKVCVRIAAIAEMPSRFGDFNIVAFWNNRDDKEHIAIVRGDVCDKDDVPVRVHSECLTGDVIGSLRCDCRDQLTAALRKIGELDYGILLYMRQEGRGIGLANKIRAYGLQDYGYDTVEANIALGFRDDERDYSVAAHMLHSLRVNSIYLMTNNPKKIEELQRYGVKVNGRLPHIIPPNEYNQFYLETKALKSGHLIDFSGRERLQEQSDLPLVNGMSEEQIAALEDCQD